MSAEWLYSIAFTQEEINLLINSLNMMLRHVDLSSELREKYQRQKDKIEKIYEDNFG